MGQAARALLDVLARCLGGALGARPFRAANPHTPAAVESAIRHAIETGTAEIGDYYELGLGSGFTFWHAQRVAAGLGNRTMKFVGVGCAAPAPRLDGVRDMLDRHGVDWNRTVLVPQGPDAAPGEALGPAHRFRPAAVALLDCRAARATEAALGFLAGRLMDRSVVLVEGGEGARGDALRALLGDPSPWRAEPVFDYAEAGTVVSIRRKAATPGRATGAAALARVTG